ncbi:MAG: PKD domain-containing protein [Muribaculaceae bacterium]|nr:PKD domain-containing protein [Muribaculaceae bacterium]
MKLLRNIALMAVAALSLTACVDKEPDYGNFPGKDVDFTYNVAGDEYTLDFYVVSTIQFNNTSSKTGAVTWDFGDGTTSSEANPKHKYKSAGLYNVSLTIGGVGTRTYPLLIYDIAPILSVTEQSDPVVVINDVTVELGIELPNPENLECAYEWTFPEGTMTEDGTPISTYSGENPGKLKFKNIGSQRIELKTYFDVKGENRRLEDSYVNVQVGSNVPAPTLYYAELGGTIKAYKLINKEDLPAGTKNLPFDMGVSSGNMPTTLVFATEKTTTAEGVTEQDNVYILDCGKQYYYVNDENSTLGDGKITVMSADGTNVNVMITNVGQQAFNDPFQGVAEGDYLYYTDRNTGIRRIPLSTRGAVETTNFSSTKDYFVVNNQLSYYGQGIAYGAIHTGLYIDKTGMFWWGKNYSGYGIYRFSVGDIGKTTGKVPHPIVLATTQPRAFTLDEDLGYLYVWMTKGTTPGVGFTQYALPGPDETVEYPNFIKFIEMDADSINSTDAEGVYTTQMAVDHNDADHRVYFGFRAAASEKNYQTGLSFFNPTTGKIERFHDNSDKILGVCINPRLTNLF